MQEMSRRNQHFTDSVIRRMTRVSLACGAINLAQGFPDFDPPKALTDRLEEISHIGPHQYPRPRSSSPSAPPRPWSTPSSP